MAIVQEDRLDAPRPEVDETEYGAQYVKAATETPVEEKKQESVERADAKPAVRKGRPKKRS